MLYFITPNTIKWTGVFYAVDADSIIKIEDRLNPSFRGEGIITQNETIIVSSNQIFEPTHIMCNDKEMNNIFEKAISHYKTSGIGVVTIYGNIVSVPTSDVLWAKYRLHIAYENE